MNTIIPTLSFRSVAVICLTSAIALTACGHTEAQISEKASTENSTEKKYSYDIKDQCYYTDACYSVPVGSSDIHTSQLKPYHAIWTQMNKSGGQWVKSPGTFEEMLTVGDNGQWQHVQKSHMGNGKAKVETRNLDRKSWQVLDMTLTFENAPPGQPKQVYYDLRGDNFTADITLPNGKHQSGQPREKALSMFDGQIGGLTLAALPLKEGYRATLPMIIPTLGIYWIEASVKGKKNIKLANGESIATWEVDANWFNLTDGDIYEPGRDGDGGTYYVAVNPGAGVPPVIEYANSGAIITWDGVRRK